MADTGYNPIPSVQPTMDAIPSQQISADEETFGAGVGRGLQRTGAVMRRAAEAQFDLTLQMEARAQETRALDASSEFSKRSNELELNFAKLNGQQAVDALPEFQKNLATIRQDIGKTLKGPLALRAYKVRTDGYETASLRSIGTHAANQGDAAYLAARDGEIAAAKDRAVLHSVNDNVSPDYTEVINSTLSKAQFLGLPKVAADAMVQSNISAVTASVIQSRIAAGKPVEALALLQGSQATNAPGTDIPLLSGDVIAPLTAQVQAGVEAFGRDYVQALDPLRRVDVLSKAITEKTGTPADFLDPGDKAEALRVAQNDLRIMADRAEADRNKILAAENERKASDLKVRVNRGLASVDEVDRAFDNNVISGPQRAEWIKQIEDGGGANADATVFSALNGSSVLDPKNSDDVKAVDGFFNRNIAPQLKVPFASAGKDAARAGVTEFVMRTGIMPSTVKRQIRGGLRAGSPEFRVTAADMIDRISESNPYVLNDFAVEDIALGQTISQAVRDGMPPAEAVKMADEMERTPKDVRDMRKQRMNARVGGNASLIEQASDNALSQLTGGGGRSWLGFILQYPQSATVSDAATAEFRRDFERAYTLTGDESAAAKSAQSVFKRSWGVSMIGGTPTLTKNAPEKLYGTLDRGVEDSAWMRQQLVDDVQSALATKGSGTLSGIAAPPAGMMEAGGMAPGELGENWATFEVAEDGVHKTVILPTEPGDRPADDATGFLGDAVERWRRGSRDRMVGIFENEVSAQAVMQSGNPSPIAPGIDPSRIVAAPDMQTGGNGTYGVMIRNDSGTLEPMMDNNGRPMRWRPEWSLSPKAAEIKTKKALQVEQERANRKSIMEQPLGLMGPM